MKDFIEPYDQERQGPASYDISIDRVWRVSGKLTVEETGAVSSIPNLVEVKPINGKWVLGPGRYVVSIRERIRIPSGMIGLVFQRSRVARYGAIWIRGGLFDPGWKGHGSLMLDVPFGVVFELAPGAPVAQIVFIPSNFAVGEYSGAFQGETHDKAKFVDGIIARGNKDDKVATESDSSGSDQLELFEVWKEPENTDEPIIVSDERHIIFYDSPLIYTGRNRKGHRVICYWMGVDTRKQLERHACVVVSDELYNEYTSGRKTLLDVMRESDSVFLLDYMSGGGMKVYRVQLDDIPDRYLPSESSFHLDSRSQGNEGE